MCSYCGCDSIEVIGRFMDEHVEIINATGELRSAVRSADAETVQTARAAVAGLLWPHTTAEEGGLFAVLSRDEVYADHITTLCGEHQLLDAYLSAITPGDEVAMARFENALRAHIDKDDNGLFPAAAIALDGPQWAEVHAATPHHHADHDDHDDHHDHHHPHVPAAVAPAARVPAPLDQAGRSHVTSL